MDEPFHVGQTRAYCAGRWQEWDNKITTFPGLYLFAAAWAWLSSGGDSACSLPTLRALNLLPALATPWLLSALLSALHPATKRVDLWANVAVLSLLPTHFFFHFLYYTDSAATCSVLLLLLLSIPPSTATASDGTGGSGGGTWIRHVCRAIAATLAIGFRQTNAVWVAFAVASCALRELQLAGGHDAKATPSLLSALAELATALSRALPLLLLRHLLPLLLLAAFALFVVVNGGVVVGDRSNHAPSLHGAQLLYLTVFAAAPFCLVQLTARLPSTLASAARACRASPLSAVLAIGLTLGLARQTLCHPFLLADNRHVTFYLWRYLLGRHWAIRYALTPGYLLLGHSLYPAVWRAHGPLIGFGLGLCAALVLVPSPLIEPRYLTLPVLLLRLHAPPLKGVAAWAPPLLLFAALNAGMLLIFLKRPYVWGDGSEARFMW